MDFMKIMDLMNYNFESEGTEIYSICGKFIEANNQILTSEQLKNASESLLPPSAFDDGRNRSVDEYNKTQAMINTMIKGYENGKGMVA